MRVLITLLMLITSVTIAHSDDGKVKVEECKISPSVVDETLIVEVSGLCCWKYWTAVSQPTGVETFKVTTSIPSLSLVQDPSGKGELKLKIKVKQFIESKSYDRNPPKSLDLIIANDVVGKVHIVNSSMIRYKIDIKHIGAFKDDFFILLGDPTISKFAF